MQKTASGSGSNPLVPDAQRERRSPFTKILLVMKLTALILTLAFLQVHAAGSAQNVTISGKDIPLKQVFSAIKQQTGYVVFYNKDMLDHTKPVTLSAYNMPLQELLQWVFKEQPVSFTISENNIILSPRVQTSLKPLIIHLPDASGRILDADGQPLSNVSIRIRGTKRGTTSGADGQFSLEVKEDEILDITAVGFTPIAVQLKGEQFRVVLVERSRQRGTDRAVSQLIVNGKQNIVIRMGRFNDVLEEAVIYNGYQKIKQKYLTGSVTSLKMDSVIQPGLSTVDKMLEGRVPGMIYMQNSGQAGAAPKLRIRGTSTYLGSREPLWVVDGIIRTNPFPIPAERINDPDFVNLLGNAISGLNPYDIDQIDVLKDATAAALYGVRAANGVIVITTKRGKPGPPTVNYNVTGKFTQRPRYTDRAIYMMDSRERVELSREMIEKKLTFRGGALEAYEKAIVDYYDGGINYETFKKNVDKAESMNTDWMGNTMRDVFATSHSLSVSGGNSSVTYRASVAYESDPGVIKKESNDRYTGILNMQMNYRKFKVDFNVLLNKVKRRYTPGEVGLLNFAYGTSRAIPLYNEDGSPYFYSTVSSKTGRLFGDFKTMNILHEMDHTMDRLESNEYTASMDLIYEIARGIQFQTKLAYTGGNSNRDKWFEENTEWATQLRYSAYSPYLNMIVPQNDPMPFGGQLYGEQVSRQNYIINGRLNFNRFLDQQNKHLLSVEVSADLQSNRFNSTASTSRGYYPGRGHSFAQIDPAKYQVYAAWQAANGLPLITENIQNSVRSYLTSTYIFNDSYVISGTTSQEFSNSFGSRSNEKFLPTWALSGRWNMQENLLRNVSWVDRSALIVSFGTAGNMLPGQTPYTIIQKGNLNTSYNAFSSTTVSFPNPDLAWEKKQDYKGTLEFKILKGKIDGSLTYFYSKTTNAFMEKQVSAVNGAPSNSYVVNGGTLENQGVEMSLNFKFIDNMGAGNKRFIWRFDPQLGQVFNRLINNNLKSRNVMVDAAALTYENYLNGTVPVNGKAVNTFYSYRFKGLNPEYGFPVFYGAEPENKDELVAQFNKMTKDQVFSTVMVESGRREPVLQGSIGNSFVYGNWTLNITFTYSLGDKIRLLQIASGNYGTFRPSSQQNLRKEFVNRWRYPGDEKFTNIPAIQGASNIQDDQIVWWGSYNLTTIFAQDYYQMYDFSDLRVVKGDYLKLQSVALNYLFPGKLCSQLHIKGANMGLTGSNLFTIANKALRGQDPSQSGSAPDINLSIRPVYAINLNISF
jgi:TonB-linked SusC/RagA family outer membrane protein